MNIVNLNLKKLSTKILQTLSTLLSWKASATSDINSLSTWRTSATTSLNDLSTWKETADDDITELSTWKESADDDIDELLTWKTSAISDISDLSTDVSDIQSDISDLSTDVSDIQTLIQLIQDNTTTTYANGTVADVISGANNKRCYLVKTGKSVRCYVGIGYADGSTAIPQNTTLFEIPEGYRPKQTGDSVSLMNFPAIAWRSIGRVVAANLTIRSNGTVQHASGSDLTAIVCSAEWETN